MKIPVSHTKPTQPGYYYCRRGFPKSTWQIVRISIAPHKEGKEELCYYSPLVFEWLNALEPTALFSARLEDSWVEGTEWVRLLKGKY